MKTTNNTVLVTGGGSGIGFDIARRFHAAGNKVILVGRSETKLKEAAAQLPGADYLTADVTDRTAVANLVIQLTSTYPNLNILVNNAGKAYKHLLDQAVDTQALAREEMETNYLAPVHLTDRLLPHLKQQQEAAIINISSIVGFVPALSIPTYSASKAALHSYTQALRLTLAATAPQIQVIEVMPPLVDTAFAAALEGDKIKPRQVADELWTALEKNQTEVHVAGTAKLYQLFLQSPAAAARALNGIKEAS